MLAATTAAHALADKGGLDIRLLDLSRLIVITDVFIIATGTSTRHTGTLAEFVEERLRDGLRRRPLRREGLDDARWILLDYGDVVVHVFDDTTRRYYDLEHLWIDAPRIEFEPIGSAQAEA